MSYNLGDIATVNDFYCENGYSQFRLNGSYKSTDEISFISTTSITFTGPTYLYCDSSNPSWYSNITFEAPSIIFNSSNTGIGFYGNNTSITFNNSSVNFDSVIYENDSAGGPGSISFTGTSSISVTVNTNNKTIIKATTLTGEVSLDIDGESIVDGVSFSIEATTNNLVVNAPTGWVVTPTTDGNVTTYAVTRAALPDVQELNINNTTYKIKDSYARRQLSYIETQKQDVITDLDTIRAGAAAGATAVQPATLNNYVTTNTSQTITASKTVSGQLSLNGINTFGGRVLIKANSFTPNRATISFAQSNDGLTTYYETLVKDTVNNTFTVGYDTTTLYLKGSATRPQYNSSDLALKSDIPTTYVHEQGVASAVWTVQHNLNKYPSVTVVDSSENVIIADVEYVDVNTVKITMNGASKGRAYLN